MSRLSRDNLSMVVIVPARGGSKRLEGKNIRLFAGRPLLTHTLEAIHEAGLGVPLAVSTDDPEITRVAEQSDVRVIARPTALATDSASTESALLHALDVFAEEGVTADWVMSLQPTSPFRSAEVIRAFAEEIVRVPEAQDCLMSVTEDHGDYWLMEDGGQMTRLFSDAPRRQQERRPVYIENSAVYIARVSTLRRMGSVIGGTVRGMPIDPIAGFDIHTETDFHVAEALALVQRNNPSPS